MSEEYQDSQKIDVPAERSQEQGMETGLLKVQTAISEAHNVFRIHPGLKTMKMDGDPSTDMAYTALIEGTSRAIDVIQSAVSQSEGVEQDEARLLHNRAQMQALLEELLYQPAIWKLENDGLTPEQVVTMLWGKAAELINAYRNLDPSFVLQKRESDWDTRSAKENLGQGIAHKVHWLAKDQYYRQVESSIEQNNLSSAMTEVARALELTQKDWLRIELDSIYNQFINGAQHVELPAVSTIITSDLEFDSVENLLGRYHKLSAIALERLKTMEIDGLEADCSRTHRDLEALQAVWSSYPREKEELAIALRVLSLMDPIKHSLARD